MFCISELGENIRYYRHLHNMTQRMLAEKMHITTQAISSWEQGLTYPDIENLCHLSEILSISIDNLLTSREEGNGTYMIGVDGGGTKTEFVLFSSAGEVKKVFRLPGTNASVKGVPATMDILRKGIDLCLESCRTVSHIFMGNAGSFLDKLKQNLQEIYPDIEIHITSDGVNALMCAEDADAAMILGTGSILLRQENEGFHRIGGWGYKLGDPGSAYNFGREACRCYCAYVNGLDRDPLIYSLMKEHATDEELGRVGRMEPYQIAAFARVIFEADRLGDLRAKGIIEKEMQDLAALAKVTCPNGGKIVAVGGIAEHYADRLLPLLTSICENKITFFVPALPPVYGACRACMAHFGIAPDADFKERFAQTYKSLEQR